MIEIRLPYYSAFICEICGLIAYSEVMEVHENHVLELQKPDVQVGDKVKIFQNCWRKDPDWKNERFVGMSQESLEYTVVKLYYNVNHELNILLRRNPEEKRGWRPGDKICMTMFISYNEFLLWREGDRKKLEEAGLIEKLG